jgi:hypothetical protein
MKIFSERSGCKKKIFADFFAGYENIFEKSGR